MAHLSLQLSSFDNGYFLERTSFFHPILKCELNTVRGKNSGAFDGYGSFQWTQAVQALCVLLIRCKAHGHSMLVGEARSLASSLDYSISKSPNWLLDMFGVDSCGTAFARRLFKRTNPERKRGGAVVVSWNTNVVGANDLKIWHDGKELACNTTLISIANLIETAVIAPQKQARLAA